MIEFGFYDEMILKFQEIAFNIENSKLPNWKDEFLQVSRIIRKLREIKKINY